MKPDGLHVVIEVSVPKDQRAVIVRNDKREKYVPFCTELFGRPRVKVHFIPLVIGATGVVADEISIAIKRLGVGIDLSWLQKIAALETVKIFRYLLGV